MIGLEKSIKHSSVEEEKVQNKILKEKEKVIYYLQVKSENLAESFVKIKSEVKSLKTENMKLVNKKAGIVKRVSTNTFSVVSVSSSPTVSNSSSQTIMSPAKFTSSSVMSPSASVVFKASMAGTKHILNNSVTKTTSNSSANLGNPYFQMSITSPGRPSSPATPSGTTPPLTTSLPVSTSVTMSLESPATKAVKTLP